MQAACAVSRSLTIQLRTLLVKAASRRIDSWTPKMAASSCPTCCSTFCLQRAQLGRRFVAGGFVLRQLGRDLVVFQALRIGIDENLVDAIGRADRHARRDGNSFTHRLVEFSNSIRR